MITPSQLAADRLAAEISAEIQRTFGSRQAPLAETVGAVARLAIECIANSDALYHDWEHTLLVTQVGLEILRGRTLFEPVEPADWAHLLVACLVHDIGYVRGVLAGDDARLGYVVDGAGNRTVLARGASDAALTPHHVERSKLFVAARLGSSDLLDASRLVRAIEYTRFLPKADADAAAPADEATLVRAADLIGQMGDPLYLKKTKALFHEFEEAGLNARLGYVSPADLVEHYPEFFWNSVSSHLVTATRYLEVTVGGRQWIAGLQANVFRAEQSRSGSPAAGLGNQPSSASTSPTSAA
ncbi:HD domain-containing protein [Aureimonas leprariae]|uniref:Metal-dependent phosphohydrolase n=1 Tax=Plantimonas leprariae TaxID=2615207 RepID=A0A7V7PLI4_9HYPH|nr:HD domain-containing protein [Aureimonas leprariae]KAB0677331.1 metal-dependent phosphohydrolase [Aureimonas leprariae]